MREQEAAFERHWSTLWPQSRIDHLKQYNPLAEQVVEREREQQRRGFDEGWQAALASRADDPRLAAAGDWLSNRLNYYARQLHKEHLHPSEFEDCRYERDAQDALAHWAAVRAASGEEQNA